VCRVLLPMMADRSRRLKAVEEKGRIGSEQQQRRTDARL
jgi:hypothetical protein